MKKPDLLESWGIPYFLIIFWTWTSSTELFLTGSPKSGSKDSKNRGVISWLQRTLDRDLNVPCVTLVLFGLSSTCRKGGKKAAHKYIMYATSILFWRGKRENRNRRQGLNTFTLNYYKKFVQNERLSWESMLLWLTSATLEVKIPFQGMGVNVGTARNVQQGYPEAHVQDCRSERDGIQWF